jgi:hypothetical protein
MTERICEHCGQQFLSETIRDKLENLGLFLVGFVLPLHAVDCFRDGWHGFLLGLLWLALAGSAIHEVYRRSKRKEGELAKLGRACPACGDRSAQVDSPLGEQLIAYWLSPQTEAQQVIVEEPSTISGEGVEAGTVGAHHGPQCG